MNTELDEARAALLRKLSAELDLFHELLEEWVEDVRIGPKVRADMRELLNPSEDGPFHYCAAHGLQRRAHPYYHDKGTHCAKCAMETEAGRVKQWSSLDRIAQLQDALIEIRQVANAPGDDIRAIVDAVMDD